MLVKFYYVGILRKIHIKINHFLNMSYYARVGKIGGENYRHIYMI